jgi:2-polyprenyl-3-methyl-5-hydroxy-6-metoxy-1,4-benzoquinol methylase
VSTSFDVSALYRLPRRWGHWWRARNKPLPTSAGELRASALYNQWWYYDVELLPGIVSKGIFPQTFPLLPRMLMRNVDLRNHACLDIGSMEGLMPALMCRQGARRVLATDALFHCYEKMLAVKHFYKVDFGFRQIGTLYELSRKLRSLGGFDFVNLSGLLYHVYSPLHVIAGVRPLLKKNGLMIVSTNVINRPGCFMEFNSRGRLQGEQNTFWYMSIELLDYVLRYFSLLPLDCLFRPLVTDDGYFSVVCRASDRPALDEQDAWGTGSIATSWEFAALCDRDMMDAQPASVIEYQKTLRTDCVAPDGRSIDLARATSLGPHVMSTNDLRDTHALRLGDTS